MAKDTGTEQSGTDKKAAPAGGGAADGQNGGDQGGQTAGWPSKNEGMKSGGGRDNAEPKTTDG